MEAHDASHAPYLSHIMSCKGCHAPTARYCEEGARLWAIYNTDFIMSRPDKLQRRAIMVAVKRDSPHLFDLLNKHVRERLEVAGDHHTDKGA